MLPNTANSSVDKLVNHIKSLADSKTVCGHPVSISFGWSTKESPEQDIEELFTDAEKYMYKDKAKQKQGNQ